jgi:hypothetical protein
MQSVTQNFTACSHGTAIRVYDDAGNVIETHEQVGRVQRVVSFARVTSRFPLKRSSMIPLLSGDCEGSDRIRRNNSIHISLGRAGADNLD